jgi:DNA-binding FadR family transcriptional regulator
MREPSPAKAGSSRAAVKQLRRHVLQFREGDYLGSEDDLLALVPVSRPTLRQAIRVLEHEQLLSVRRGLNGGYYARRPDLDSVANAAALYLDDQATSMQDFLGVAEVLNAEVCRRAASSARDDVRERLRTVLASDWSRPFHSDDECQRRELELELLLLELADNPVLRLYMRMTFRVGVSTLRLRVFRDSHERREIWREQRWRQGEAILNRDTELAVAYGARHYKLMNAWFAEILAAEGRSPADPLNAMHTASAARPDDGR